MHTRVAVTVRDEQIPAWTDRQIRWEMKRRPGVLDRSVVDARRARVRWLSARAELHQQMAFRRILSHGVIQIIDAPDRVVRPNRDAMRPNELLLAPREQKSSLAIENRHRMIASTEHKDAIARVRRHGRDLGDI